MPEILAIETSAESCSVAFSGPEGLLEEFQHAPMKHADLLLPMVRSVLTRSGRQLTDIDAIAFGRGPGSFTSLRIGIGVVQGLAWGADLPVIPISSLAAVAQAAKSRLDSEHDDPGSRLVVAMDARMDEVYWAVFDGSGPKVIRADGPEQVSAPSDVLSSLQDAPWVAVGNGFERFDELAAAAGKARSCLPGIWPNAGAVLALAEHWLNRNEPLNAMDAQPVYIRNNVAHKPKKATGT